MGEQEKHAGGPGNGTLKVHVTGERDRERSPGCNVFPVRAPTVQTSVYPGQNLRAILTFCVRVSPMNNLVNILRTSCFPVLLSQEDVTDIRAPALGQPSKVHFEPVQSSSCVFSIMCSSDPVAAIHKSVFPEVPSAALCVPPPKLWRQC